jgi:hypothetical protein
MPMKVLTGMILIVAVLAAAACGDAGKAGATHSRSTISTRSGQATTALSDSQLIEAADAICQRLNDEFKAARPIRNLADIQREVPHRAVAEHHVVAELQKLHSATLVGKRLQRIVAYRKTLAEELTELGADAKRKDMTAIKAFALSKARLHHALHVAAQAAGLRPCGSTGAA